MQTSPWPCFPHHLGLVGLEAYVAVGSHILLGWNHVGSIWYVRMSVASERQPVTCLREKGSNQHPLEESHTVCEWVHLIHCIRGANVGSLAGRTSKETGNGLFHCQKRFTRVVPHHQPTLEVKRPPKSTQERKSYQKQREIRIPAT
eukprot:670755-Amphidinium_carterae.2